MVYLIILCIIIISIIFYHNYTTLRYKAMVKHQNFKLYLKKNDVYILSILNKANSNIDKIISVFETNVIVQELVQQNKISIRLILLIKSILQFINKVIIYIIQYLKK